MSIEWKTVFAVIIAVALLWGLHAFFTKRELNKETGEIKTKFSGFGY